MRKLILLFVLSAGFVWAQTTDTTAIASTESSDSSENVQIAATESAPTQPKHHVSKMHHVNGIINSVHKGFFGLTRTKTNKKEKFYADDDLLDSVNVGQTVRVSYHYVDGQRTAVKVKSTTFSSPKKAPKH